MLKGKLCLHPDFRSMSRVTPANEKRKEKGGFDDGENMSRGREGV